jgi:hypothetical protein
MNEEEAKSKWCPFTRVALSEGMSANRTASLGHGGYADIADETRCLGSGCMMWEWRERTALQDEGRSPDHGDCMLKSRRV